MNIRLRTPAIVLVVSRFVSAFYPITRASARQHYSTNMSSSSPWTPGDASQAQEAKKLEIWPLDEHNAKLLNEVHPRGDYRTTKEPYPVYDLIAIGAGAGGLISSKQSARRGAKSAMISELLAGGDCLNVGCVPSKALIRSAKAVSQVRKAAEMGVVGIDTSKITVDFPKVMERLRKSRATIAPADGHEGTEAAGTHVYQGRGRFTGPNTVEVNGQTLQFKLCVLATGGRPALPDVPGLKEGTKPLVVRKLLTVRFANANPYFFPKM
jgi:hypothetical protein